jgi:hypothetical protein
MILVAAWGQISVPAIYDQGWIPETACARRLGAGSHYRFSTEVGQDRPHEWAFAVRRLCSMEEDASSHFVDNFCFLISPPVAQRLLLQALCRSRSLLVLSPAV